MPRFSSFHHCRFIVGNAAQAATFYVSRFGFERVAYRGLETGCRDVVSHVVKQGDIVLCLTSPLNPNDRELGEHIVKHGDGVKDVAMAVDDCRAVFESAKANGATVVKEPWEESDQFGKVVMATIQTVSSQSNHKETLFYFFLFSLLVWRHCPHVHRKQRLQWSIPSRIYCSRRRRSSHYVHGSYWS
mmetsp:Transcript_424/g.568  ORF Transcript_424/g.568 Transcript_424/m.568 type:complete len:187 (-) Transcript_424:667-1227(-)